MDYLISGVISLTVAVLVSGLLAPSVTNWFSRKTASKNRIISDTIVGIDCLAKLITDIDKQDKYLIESFNEFLSQGSYNTGAVFSDFAKQMDSDIKRMKEMQTNLSLEWRRYQVHFENRLVDEIDNFTEIIDGDISMIDKAQYKLNFNRVPKKQAWRVNDLKKSDKIVGDLYKLRNELNS